MKVVRVARYIDVMRTWASHMYYNYDHLPHPWVFSVPRLLNVCEMFYANRDLFLKGKFE
jgi:hypothetical protein